MSFCLERCHSANLSGELVTRRVTLDADDVPEKHVVADTSSAGGDIDWDSPASVDERLPPLPGHGGCQVPKSLGIPLDIMLNTGRSKFLAKEF